MSFDFSVLDDDGAGGLSAGNLPRRAPKLVLADPLPVVNLGAIQYSVLPARCVQDPRINKRPHLLLLLAALCLHSSQAGICYPSQHRLAKLCGRSPSWVSRYIRELEAFGYVVRVKSMSKRKRHAVRRIVIYDPGSPLPPLEQPIPMPWTAKYQSQPQKEKPDMRLSYAEKERQQIARAAKLSEIQAEKDAWNVADYFANRYSALFETQVQSAPCFDVAMRWLKVVDVVTARAHIDRLLTTSKFSHPDLMPSVRLSDYPEPKPETVASA